MSNTKKVKIQAIQDNAITELKVSGYFHKRLVGLYFNYVNKFEPNKFKELCEIIGKNEIDKITDEKEKQDAFAIQTILILLREIENNFNEAGLIKPEEIEVPITED
ncbi:MAG TPA: hypothetical protein PLG47_05095 [Candidatus Dojkabacteria bacterium]|nr:hypothetical protein [Candidatus Dojkabacteria bacterium]